MASRRCGERQYQLDEGELGRHAGRYPRLLVHLLGDFKASFTRFATITPDGNLADAVDPASIG